MKSIFRTKFSENIFNHKYRHDTCETWEALADVLVEDVCKDKLIKSEKQQLKKIISEMKFIPGGRYLYYAGRPFKAFNNCYLLKSEADSREDWADLSWKSESCLMTGGGIGNDYSVYRPKNSIISRTGGLASGPVSKMKMINEIGREVMQGGSRRCLPGNATISMADGSRRTIQSLNPGDYVHTRFGPKKVLAVSNEGFREVVKITTEFGAVFSSKNHKWLCADNTRRKRWMLAESISINNKLYFHPTPTKGCVPKDLKECYMLGYFMGDGCAYSSNRTHEVTFQFPNNQPFQEKMLEISEIFSKNGYNPISRSGNGECTELRVRGKELVAEFQEYKVPNKAPNIPDDILEWDIEARCAFIAGWWDADGSFGEDSWRISNTHKETRDLLVIILTSLGFVSSTFNIDIRLSSYQRQSFLSMVGKYMFKSPKAGEIFHKTNEIPAKVLAVELLEERELYDVQIEEVEEFIAYGFVSHNSAIYASLNWKHADINEFIHAKDWKNMKVAGTEYNYAQLKDLDFNFPCPLDMTNISVNYDTEWLETYKKTGELGHVFLDNCKQALSTAEPGLSFNFYEKENETLRNACCEVVSEDDSDVCNLGSVNMANIESKEEFQEVVDLSTKFLLCGTLVADLPYEKVYKVREKNRRLGLGLMGVHEWLLKRNYRYEVTPELHEWLSIYKNRSNFVSRRFADKLGISRPVASRAIAPTGSIGILASTTTGIEPLFAVAYKRRYLKGRNQWNYQYVIDGTAKHLIEEIGINPDSIETAVDLASDYERRIKFQADVQDYVDMAISSTINLPHWGSELNNESMVVPFAKTLAKYAERLRGFTCYPDGARGGQPITPVKYGEAVQLEGQEFEETFHDICSISGKGGHCGV